MEFDELPPLSQQQYENGPRCKICGESSRKFDIVDFNKICSEDFYKYGFSEIVIPYYRCVNCEFLFTNYFDKWEMGDYSKFIYNTDYEKVDPDYINVRPRRSNKFFSKAFLGYEHLSFLDYGSGTGLFAAQMRENGFYRYYSYDPFSMPDFPNGKFSVITAIEVIEHTPEPIKTFAEMASLLKADGLIIFSQVLQPDNITSVRCNWWYIAPRNGHISTYSIKTLKYLADHFNFDLFQLASGFYALASRASPREMTKKLLTQLGATEHHILELKSSNSTDQSAWNGVETVEAGDFQWTRCKEVYWDQCYFAMGVTELRIKVLMEIEPGYASNAQLIVGGLLVTTRFDGRFILAEFRSDSAQFKRVILQTNDPIIPKDQGRSLDERPLGLAISAT